LKAKRLFASFKVIGTLSSRMSGTDDLNPQGIAHSKDVRSTFPLYDSHKGEELHGGDFDAFEVTLADAAYNDPKLRADLMSGKKVHGLFAMSLFPGKSYEDIAKSKGNKDLDMYDMGKRGVFAIMYGGNEQTLVSKLGVSLEIAEKAYKLFTERYPGVGKARQKVFDMFCSMRQEGGIGSKVSWHEPSEYIESLFGFRRYFTLENNVCRVLFELANNPPKEWKQLKIRVVRRDREQSAVGAVQSSLYAAAFGIQASNMRAAANHVIQSSGAQITKSVQRKIWDLQPVGHHKFVVRPMNIHDEILCPLQPEIAEKVRESVVEAVDAFKERVPLIKLEWQKMNNWGEK
jgi:DNA polymerase I-like protein with 3'-5' exonuclease and polymerase domains